MEILQTCAKPSKYAISFHPPSGYWNINIPLVDARIYSEYSRMLINRKNIWWCCHSQLSWHHDNSCFSVQPRWRKKMHWNLNSQKTPHTSPSGDPWDIFWIAWRKTTVIITQDQQIEMDWGNKVVMSTFQYVLLWLNMSQLTFFSPFQMTYLIFHFFFQR